MNIRSFIRKSIDNQKKLLFILIGVSLISGVLALAVQLLFGESSVYRGEIYIELNPDIRPIVNINTAGIPVEVLTWDGDSIKAVCVSELPLIIEESEEFGREVTINQDDGFAVSIFTPDLFRYRLTVFLPRITDYKEINVSTNSGDIDVILPEHMLVALSVDTVRGLSRITPG
ncbi:MAG: DUF4097 domain-containing protein [Oscillospiraceae bacterium]|nr:DUF4097 domain-containing protein [Oscillospiraceae bacterium]